MGTPHFSENGLALHKTFGVPYLPASSIKGMLRAWLTDSSMLLEGDKLKNWEDRISELFGSESDEESSPAAKGMLTFHDALFAEFKLRKDVMTVHTPSYYLGKQWNANEKPIPIEFAYIEGSVPIVISWEQSDKLPSDINDILRSGLTNALRYYGIGAKKSGGVW